MSNLLYFNGVNGTSGTYGLEPMTDREFSDHILGIEEREPENLAELKEKLKQDVADKIFDITRSLLSESNAELDVASRGVWLEELIAKLEAMPINSLDRSIDKGIGRGSCALLAEKLGGIVRLEPLAGELKAKGSWDELLATLSQSELLVSESVPWSDLLNGLNEWLDLLSTRVGHLAVIESVDPTDLAQAGWGIVFAARDPRVPELKKALQPLLELRRAQASRDKERFKIYERGQGYRPDDTARTFLARHGADPSKPADPDIVPYYLLIVGSPAEIPFRFQYQLDVQYAVGRIDFGDDIHAYENYARSVVEAEKEGFALPPKATFFSVENPDDRATALSAEHLVKPLHKSLKDRYTRWQFDAVLGDKATKSQLLRLMGGEDTPAFLFTASHGMEFDLNDPKDRQVLHQGALLCSDWPGPNAWRGEIPRDFYLAGDDLTRAERLFRANLLGMIAFFFACYGAGTPLYDEFTRQAFKERREAIAEQSFVAALPKAMLSLSRGGALAVIGHVERAWGTSFLGSKQSEQIAVFESTIERLLKGHPVGSAMEYFNGRYAALSTELTAVFRDIDFGLNPDPYELAGMWTANNDARGYVVIGDPAVRLPVAETARVATGRGEIAGKPVDIGSLLSLPRPHGSGLDERLAKPDIPEITEQDWQNTPLPVKRYVKRLESQLE